MGVILLGDKTAAARWLAYAKSRAAALAKQGNNLSQTFSPAEGVTIRVQTLQGTPRVWIEAGGMDYIASDYDASHPLEVPTDSSLYGGRLMGGAAKPVGKSTFGQFAGHNLYPLGGNEFLAGPPQQTFAGAVQLVTVKGGKIASGQTFSPWQDPTYDITGVHDVLYSGLVQNGTDENGAPIYKKRLHVLYHYERHIPREGYVDYRITQPTIATSVDGGASFSITPFVITVDAVPYSPAYIGNGDLQNIDIMNAVFCGDNRIDLIGRASGVSGGVFTASVCTLTSADGGATWELNYTPNPLGTPLSHMTCAYIGGSKVLGVSTNLFGNSRVRETYLSTDYGATFSQIEGPAAAILGNTDAGFSDVVCLGPDSAAYYRNGNFYRTHDAGLSWEALPVPAEVTPIQAGRFALLNSPVLPDPPPAPPKTIADYAKIIMLTAASHTVQIAKSDDGGRTWKKGGIIPKRVPNVGLISKSLPPFPIFPDLHKNGLTIP